MTVEALLDARGRVYCYACGGRYEPTELETAFHTRHAASPFLLRRRYRRRNLDRHMTTPPTVREGRLLDYVDRVQAERDAAVRAALAAENDHRTLRARLSRLAGR